MNKELYKNKVKEFCNLTNVSDLSTKPTMQAIYDKINGRFTDDDMIRSFDEMMEADVIKLTYPILKRYLTKYKDIRVNTELQRQKLKEKNETAREMLPSEIQELIDMVLLKKKPNTLPQYLKANSTVLLRDGRRLDVWIDPTDPNFDYGKALSVSHEQQNDHVSRRVSINLKMVNHKILSGQKAPTDQSADHDFIPELELPDDAFQGTLGLDRPTGGNA